MKFRRNVRMSRTHLDMAPFASVFFLILIFVLLGSLIYTPGVHIELPIADDLPGVNGPAVAVAMDARGQLYFENQLIAEDALSVRLAEKVKKTPDLTLVLFADKAVTLERQKRLMLLASKAGIKKAHLAMQPAFAPQRNPAP